MKKVTFATRYSLLATRYSLLATLIFIAMQVITIKAHGQYLLQKNLETDFGAHGDGVFDNTDAFIRAGIFFSNFLDITGNGDTIGELIIPSFYPANSLTPAVYKVGRQLVFNDSFLVTEIFNGIEKRRKFRHTNIAQGAISGLGDTLENYGMFFLNNVHNLTIKGEVAASPPTIRYKDGLMFGSFLTPTSTFTAGNFTQTNNTNTIQPLLFYGINVDHTTKGWTAPFLFIKNCSDITISDLRLDGNNVNFIWGGVWSNNGGIQLPGDGIFCQGTTNIDLANVHVNQFGRDGMTLEKACENITINDCHFNKNNRTGFGFICAKDVTVNNCQFNETGQITTPGFEPSLSNPGSGLDIEPDAGSSPQDECENGIFKECRFYNNLGPALSTNFVIADFVENMLFENDTFYSSRQTGIHCAGKKIVFKKCGIYASVATSSIANAEADATKYIDCDFADKPYNNIYWAHTNPLFNVPGYGEIQRHMRWTNFKNCTFNVNDKDREFFWLNWTTSGMPESSWTVIDDCTFTYNNEGRPGLNASFMRGVL
ncbi:MAG: right-handed parallel beta-helix repeat-containing protein [Bacteroidetes bacterium]|nr:right-handed parallel beta-helix repeat-containing protein [Bacteroidota bacterium]